MNKDHIEDWEKDLQKDLFDQSVPTDDKDFGQFMDKLEDSGYFEKDKKRPFLWWILGGIAFVGVVYFLWPATGKVKEIKVKVQEKVAPIRSGEEVILEQEEVSVDVHTNKTELPTTPKPKEREPKSKKAAVIEVENIVEEEKTKVVVDTSLFADTTENEPEVTEEETVVAPVAPVKKKPTVIIMTTDTTVIRDTSHVKEKRKKKKKK